MAEIIDISNRKRRASDVEIDSPKRLKVDFDLDCEQQMIDECAKYDDYVSSSNVGRKRKATGVVFENKSPKIVSFDDSINESAMVAVCEANEIPPQAFDDSFDDNVKVGAGFMMTTSFAPVEKTKFKNMTVEKEFKLISNRFVRAQLAAARGCTNQILKEELQKMNGLKFKISMDIRLFKPPTEEGKERKVIDFRAQPNLITITNEDQIDDAIDSMYEQINAAVEKYSGGRIRLGY